MTEVGLEENGQALFMIGPGLMAQLGIMNYGIKKILAATCAYLCIGQEDLSAITVHSHSRMFVKYSFSIRCKIHKCMERNFDLRLLLSGWGGGGGGGGTG